LAYTVYVDYIALSSREFSDEAPRLIPLLGVVEEDGDIFFEVHLLLLPPLARAKKGLVKLLDLAHRLAALIEDVLSSRNLGLYVRDDLEKVVVGHSLEEVGEVRRVRLLRPKVLSSFRPLDIYKCEIV